MSPTTGLMIAAGTEFIKTVAPKLTKEVGKRWQEFNWHTAQGDYYDRIEKNHGTTRILGKPDPIPLDNIFTDVYLLDKPTAVRRYSLEELQREWRNLKEEQKRESGFDLVQDGKHQRLHILGKPGAGKTTFLKWLALNAARNEIKKIPIFVSLKEWADSGLELMPFLVKQFDICRFPEAEPLIEYILDRGDALVLFDGLDETQQEGDKRLKISNEIENFSLKFHKSQILVTCRIAATEHDFDKFTYVEVADLTPEQVARYVANWFGDDAERTKQFNKEFNREDNESLREMASTPLLLSLLCLNFAETGTFPDRRVEIYEEGINALLHKWDASRSVRRDDIYKGLSLGRKRQMFARIAVQTFEKNDYFVKKDKLARMIEDYLRQLPNAPPEAEIDGEAVLKAIEAQHSIFVERAQNIYSFSHLTFQEYFTAKYIIENETKGTLNELLHVEKITDDRWREVILNTASLLDDADKFFVLFKNAINQSVADEPEIVKLLRWAETKVNSIETKLEPIEVKILYTGLELRRFRALEYFIALSLAFELDLVLSLDFTRALSFDIYFASSNNFLQRSSFLNSLDRERALALDLYLTVDHHRSLAFFLDLKIISALQIAKVFLMEAQSGRIIFLFKESFVKFWQRILIDSEKVAVDLSTALKNLSLPSNKAADKDWEMFLNELKKIAQMHRDVGHDWNFNDEQINKSNFYFIANGLLVKCLKLAVVSDRKTIKNSLMSPPVSAD